MVIIFFRPECLESLQREIGCKVTETDFEGFQTTEDKDGDSADQVLDAASPLQHPQQSVNMTSAERLEARNLWLEKSPRSPSASKESRASRNTSSTSFATRQNCERDRHTQVTETKRLQRGKGSATTQPRICLSSPQNQQHICECPLLLSDEQFVRQDPFCLKNQLDHCDWRREV